MSEQDPNEQPAPNPPASEDPSKSERERRSRPRTLTSEQRRLLGKPRPLHERVEAGKENINETAPADEPAEPAARQYETREPQKPGTGEHAARESAEPESASEQPGRLPRVAVRKADSKSSRPAETQRAALIISAIVVLFLAFYVGKKFDYWRYLWMTRNKPRLSEKVPDKYPGVPASELVEQALASEHAGRLTDAAERLIAAKHKDLRYRGILFRVGKLAYDNGNFDTADRLLERAIAFGENIDVANYLRGVIATRRGNLPTAERFFQAAVTTEPFVADYYYYWAEALRLGHHYRDAIARYEQAARRARDDQDLTVCQFKVRMARLEGGESAKLKDEIEAKGSTGPLPLDWLLTEAAVAIRERRFDDAVRSVIAARASSFHTENGGGIFVSCKDDALFQDACKKYAELADAFEVKATSPSLVR
jgi:tetratricopeptide (TPR) repeat protein